MLGPDIDDGAPGPGVPLVRQVSKVTYDSPSNLGPGEFPPPNGL